MAKEKEIEVENKDVYVKIDADDSIELKKTLLEIIASQINMQIVSERFKEKRAEEAKQKSVAKRYMKEIATHVNGMIEKLPKTKEIPRPIRKQIAEQSQSKKSIGSITEAAAAITERKDNKSKEASLTKQLEEIRKRIASMQ